MKEAFQVAKRALPSLARVGVAWNPAESNSEAFTLKAREACRELGLTLLEANVDSSAAVTEAVQSLVARGAQALWVGGDNTMLSTLGSAIATARTARIPVFTIVPGAPDRGTLFDIGLDFQELGRIGGLLAGRRPAGPGPGDGAHPRRAGRSAAAPGGEHAGTGGLAGPLADSRRGAGRRHYRRGCHGHARARRAARGAGENMARGPDPVNQVQDVEEAEAGVLAGFRESGLVEGRDYVITIRNAQGDMATVSALVDAALGERADLLVTFSTPTLQAALQRARQRADRLHVCRRARSRRRGQDRHGPPAQRHRRLHGAGLRRHDRADPPRAASVQSLGTLFVPAEVNSVFNRNLLEAACRKAGLDLIEVPANTSSDVPDAAWRWRPASGRDLPDSRQPHRFGVPDRRNRPPARPPSDLRVPDQPGARRRRRDRRARLRRRRTAIRGDGRSRDARRTARRHAVSGGGKTQPDREPLGGTPHRPHHSAGSRREGRRGRGSLADMEITRRAVEGWTELAIVGRLDGYWAEHLDAGLADAVREGHHKLRLDLSNVSFVSSAGIGVLVKFYKRLEAIHGALVIVRASGPVRTVLDMTRLTAMLVDDTPDNPGTLTLGSTVVRRGLLCELFELEAGARMRVRAIGGEQQSARRRIVRSRRSPCRARASTIAVGIGAFGAGDADGLHRFGEFLAVSGAAACLPADGTEVPDYLVASGAEAATVRVSRGVVCDGAFARHLRFETTDRSGVVPLADVAAVCLEMSRSEAAAVVIMAETSALIGAALRTSPFDADTTDLFDFPDVRRRLTFTAEPAFRGSLALVVGVVQKGDGPVPAAQLRPLGGEGNLAGHFHAAAFSFRPFKKGRLVLGDTVRTLFEDTGVQGVLHLLNDNRPVVGVGQSEFTRGACWIGAIARMTLLIGALTVGLILSLLALGVFISFRIFEFPGHHRGWLDHPGRGGGRRAARSRRAPGHRHRWQRFFGDYRGRADRRHSHPLPHQRAAVGHPGDDRALLDQPPRDGPQQRAAARGADPRHASRARGGAAVGSTADLRIWGWDVAMRDAAMLVLALAGVASVGLLIYVFRTNIGTAMQAAGDNPQMIRALGVNVENMVVLGLAVSNGLVALSGALLAQYQGFADVQMGIGMVVWGLASIIIGEALVGVRQLGLIITGAVMGSVLFRLLVAIALRGGLNPNDLKLVTAAFVFLALVLPGLVTRLSSGRRKRQAEAR